LNSIYHRPNRNKYFKFRPQIPIKVEIHSHSLTSDNDRGKVIEGKLSSGEALEISPPRSHRLRVLIFNLVDDMGKVLEAILLKSHRRY